MFSRNEGVKKTEKKWLQGSKPPNIYTSEIACSTKKMDRTFLRKLKLRNCLCEEFFEQKTPKLKRVPKLQVHESRKQLKKNINVAEM